MKKIFLVTAALSVAFSISADGQTSQSLQNHDMRCFLASSLLVSSQDETVKSAGTMSALFFAGKIFGRDPDIDLAAAMRAETPKLDRDAIKAVLVDCGAELKGRGEQIRAAGAELKNDSQRLGPL